MPDGKRIVLLVLILAVAALSFLPCIHGVVLQAGEVYYFRAPDGGSSTMFREGQLRECRYMWGLCCAVSAVELLLLFLSRRLPFRIIGLLLHLGKIIAPIPLLHMMDKALGCVCRYSLLLPGYGILVLGAVIALWYLLLMRSDT